MCSSPECREDAVSPVVGGNIKTTEHLWSCDRLRVHPHLSVRLATVSHCLHQHSDTLCLAGSRRTEDHHAVTDSLSLVELDQLQHPRRMMDQLELGDLDNGTKTLQIALGVLHIHRQCLATIWRRAMSHSDID